jgi:hypothetical protein
LLQAVSENVVWNPLSGKPGTKGFPDFGIFWDPFAKKKYHM